MERFIRGSVLEWAFEPLAKANDPRLLLLFDRKSRELVGLAAHERAKLQAGDGSVFDATKLEVAALSVNWQGRTFESGDRASDVLMSAVMTDVSARAPPRDARVFAVVHEQNLRSIALCNRHGLINDMSRPNPTYRRLITEHR
ncbi:MAG: hypothetical protein HYV07_07395 [Deltaproteobacteria bacterium]|nr:hypothetical protein [Deltaproteobacteria bacterium]